MVSDDGRTASPALAASNLSVTFGENQVLSSAGIEARRGSVHALLGQNGSGKSTLLKVLSGVYAPDPGGTLTIGGHELSLPTTPDDVRRVGLGIVHQDLGMVNSLTVVEAVRLRLFRPGPLWRISWRAERRRVKQAFERYEVEVPIDSTVGELSVASRTVVAVIRALEEMAATGDRTVLILDEPTPHLAESEVKWLFEIVRRIASQGTAVLIVTHRLEEVFAVADHVTVLRDGRVALSSSVADVTHESLSHAVLGRALVAFEGVHPGKRQGEGRALAVEMGSATESAWTLGMDSGEILGVTGLIGEGWERVPYLLFGADQAASGRLTIEARSRDLASWTPRDALAAGLALIPRDRSSQGALGEFSLAENLSMLVLGRYFQRGILRFRAEVQRSEELIRRFDIRPDIPGMPFKLLSGGNQQKAILAKWWERDPKIILLDEPTQGVDIGARASIYRLIAEAADRGAAVLVASVEYEELAKICTRVVVFRGGSPKDELEGADLTQARIVDACYERNNTYGE